ncbi:MAG: tetratricopeptide repeat protein [Acidobacteria bacterium]|nr:tetratricopeptide repeat protein [Acidobacteriota bacterium]
MDRSFRTLIVSILALWKGLSQKEIGARAGVRQKRVSSNLKKTALEDELYEQLLRGVEGRPAEVAIVTACLEALAALEADGELTAEEQDEIETGVLEGSRHFRSDLTARVRRSRAAPAWDDYPRAAELETARWHAGEQWSLLESLPEEQQVTVVRVTRDFQNWALMELVCGKSAVQASRDVERAAGLARLAMEIAARVRGPEGWQRRVRGYAAAHGSNVLRVTGKLKASDAAFEEAKRLWLSGSDPDEVLDPGRLLDLEASLRRDQRRFGEALDRLEEALSVGRCPERYLINKGINFLAMGEYEKAVEAFRQAQPLVEEGGDTRLANILSHNLASAFTHLGRYGEAAEVGRRVRAVAVEMGDEIGVLRGVWLEGRIAAGLGRREEALRLLEQARREFAARTMWYDVALALLESAALWLDEGRTAKVKALARDLEKVFESEEVHREALAALRLFQEAAEREAATAGLARRVLGYLFRARHDQGLRFTASGAL